VSRRLPQILEDAENGLPLEVRELLATLKESHDLLAARIERLTEALEGWHRQNEVSRRLAAIPGVGVLPATVLAALLGERGGDHWTADSRCRYGNMNS